MKTQTNSFPIRKILLLGSLTAFMNFHSFAQSSPQESMRVSLYQLNSNGSTNLADGNLTNYNDTYLNDLSDDAIKMNNFGENFGILRDNTRLAIELRKKIPGADTSVFCMWNMQQRSYRILLTTYNLEHPGLQGYFEDSYLNTSTPIQLNSINTFDFSVNATAASYLLNRFRVVFKNPTYVALATNFTTFNGKMTGADVQLLWTVDRETSMKEYVVEHSVDRINFNAIKTVQPSNAAGTKSYTSLFVENYRGDNFYRIKGTSLFGETMYSSILKLNSGKPLQEILVYPNPIVDRKINIFFPGLVVGKYSFQLYSSNGIAQALPPIQINQGSSVQSVQLPKTISAGVYRIKIVAPDNTVIIKTINVL